MIGSLTCTQNTWPPIAGVPRHCGLWVLINLVCKMPKSLRGVQILAAEHYKRKVDKVDSIYSSKTFVYLQKTRQTENSTDSTHFWVVRWNAYQLRTQGLHIEWGQCVLRHTISITEWMEQDEWCIDPCVKKSIDFILVLICYSVSIFVVTRIIFPLACFTSIDLGLEGQIRQFSRVNKKGLYSDFFGI